MMPSCANAPINKITTSRYRKINELQWGWWSAQLYVFGGGIEGSYVVYKDLVVADSSHA